MVSGALHCKYTTTPKMLQKILNEGYLSFFENEVVPNTSAGDHT